MESAGRSAVADSVAIRPPSGRLLRLFSAYSAWYLRRHFHAIRIAHAERVRQVVEAHGRGTPVIIYLNHSSWWDPLTCIMVARMMWSGAVHYAPMDEAALRRYRFFNKLGMFPVELGTARGAAQLLRAATAVLRQRRAVLWITPQGEFADVRQRPPKFKHGLEALLRRVESVAAVPLAIEYTFWDERMPEVLLNWGTPVLKRAGTEDTASWGGRLEAELAAAQDELRELAMTRSAAKFETVNATQVGVGGVYGLWERARARMRGVEYTPEHGSIHRA